MPMELKCFNTLYVANIVPEFGDIFFLYVFYFFSVITWNELIWNYKIILNAINLISIPPSNSWIYINLL